MTNALCFNCGETKFGAFCPCQKCGVGSSGNQGLDILFSDHRMSIETLDRFGGVIRKIATRCDDPIIRFWIFIVYVSSHPSRLLSVTPPAELKDRVETLLAEMDLPMVSADIKPPRESSGPPQRLMQVPDELLRRYVTLSKFVAIQRVQIRRSDGFVIDGTLMETDGMPQLAMGAEIACEPEEIVAIRTAPGCLFGWLKKPKWVESAL